MTTTFKSRKLSDIEKNFGIVDNTHFLVFQKPIKPDNIATCIKFSKVDDEDKLYNLRDHEHFTGIFRAAVHVVCNLKVRSSYSYFMPLVLNNMSR